MPEYPDIVVYIEALEKRIAGRTLERVLIASPFLLRTAVPPISTATGKKVRELRRMGKRICIGLEGDLWLVLHLMIAGRLHWKDSSAKPSKRDVAAFCFDNGTLTLTEAGTQKRASLHLVSTEAGLRELDPSGLEIFEADVAAFIAQMARGAEDCEIIALRAAAGENDFARPAGPNGGDAIAGVIEQGPRPAADMMHT